MERSRILAGTIVVVLIGVFSLLFYMEAIPDFIVLIGIMILLDLAGIYYLLIRWQRKKTEIEHAEQPDDADWTSRSPMYNRQVKDSAGEDWEQTSKPAEWSAPAPKETPRVIEKSVTQSQSFKETHAAPISGRTQSPAPKEQPNPQRKNAPDRSREHPLVRRAAEFDKAKSQEQNGPSNKPQKKG